MDKNARNKISVKVNQSNDRIISSYQNISKKTSNNTSSSYSMRNSNINNKTKEVRTNSNNNKYLICNTSPNTKISKHLNLTRTIQSIPRSSHSKEGNISNKFINKNNILSGVKINANANTSYSYNHNYNKINNNNSYIITSTKPQTISFSLTENIPKIKYQKNNNI